MLQLETRAAMFARLLADESPHLFKHPQPAFSWEMVTLREAREKGLVDWEDRSCHKTLTCVNHPKSRYSTKNPFDRSVLMMKGASGGDGMYDVECSCPFTDMRVVIR